MSSVGLTIDYADILFVLNEWLKVGDTLSHHAEFEDPKRAAVETVACLGKEHRPFRIELDQQHRGEQKGGQQDDSKSGREYVEGPLECLLCY